VLEVGLGGRFDSTNVIDSPLAAVITTISYDHMAQLGDTLDKIAFEKAGIIKRGTDVVLYPRPGKQTRFLKRYVMKKVPDFTNCLFIPLT